MLASRAACYHHLPILNNFTLHTLHCLAVNTHHIMDAAVPFGGYKQSGFGREHGAAILEHYTQASFYLMCSRG